MLNCVNICVCNLEKKFKYHIFQIFIGNELLVLTYNERFKLYKRRWNGRFNGMNIL